MANIIAIVWDYDKTLIDGYMQDPIFKHFGADEGAFWREVDGLYDKYLAEQGVRVNRDTIYLNHFINKTREGVFKGLNNKMLREFGKEQRFYPGATEIFSATKNRIANDPRYLEYNIRVEHYLVSTGFKETIVGSEVAAYVDGVWGCEFIEREVDGGEREIAEIGYALDNTSKTRALFEINKGVPQNPEVDVNSKVPDELRRVPFENTIYIADGPSDVPAFSLLRKAGGATFAVYPKGNVDAFKQVDKLRADGRVEMCAEADYTDGSTAYLWIMNKVEEIADRLYQTEREKLRVVSSAPKHLS